MERRLCRFRPDGIQLGGGKQAGILNGSPWLGVEFIFFLV